MTNSEKWNLIVDGYRRLYSQPETKVQEEWEMYCAELFEYKKVLHEIDAQRHLTVGSGGAIIPDIILRTNGKDIFDIELKQYSLQFNEMFETQLISYLNMTHLSVGMVVCNKIYLYYYEYATISINKIEIPFEENNADGIALMRMLTKDSFSANEIKTYILERIGHEHSVLEIKKCLTNDWIKETIKAKLVEQYAKEDVDRALAGYVFKASNPLIPINPVISPSLLIPKNPSASSANISSVIHQWCREKMWAGEMLFLQDSSNKKYARFTTDDLDKIIPYQDGLKSGWNNGRFYSYEVVNYGGQFKMWIAFSNKNAPEHIRQVYLNLMQASGSRPKKSDWQWWCLFSTPRFLYDESTTKEQIFATLDSQFSQIREKVNKMLESI